MHRCIFLLIGLAMFGPAVWLIFRSGEPVYQGRRLSEWTRNLGISVSPSGLVEVPWKLRLAAEEVVWDIGTNAIPFLIENIKHPKTTAETKLENWLENVTVLGHSGLVPPDRTQGAWEAIGVMGLKAKPWIAEFDDIVANSPPEVATAGLLAVSGIPCEEACAVLTRGMASTNDVVKRAAIAGLANMGWRAQTAMPELIGALHNSNTSVRFIAASAFAEVQANPQTVMPALLELLDDTNAAVKWMAVRAIATFGNGGLSASNTIEQLTHSTNRRLARMAMDAIHKLDWQLRDGAVVRGSVHARKMALVFTGHQFAEGGTKILDDLDQHRSKASFFLTGDFLSRAELQPLVERIRSEGHLLGPHSDKHLLYCTWDSSRRTLVERHEFRRDLLRNLQRISPEEFDTPHFSARYFLPPYEHYNRDIVGWTRQLGMTLINFTPATRSNADYTGEADTNFVSSQTIFDSILQREREDPHGLNGFILLLHLGSGPGRTDKFHHRFGELLDYLAGKGYQFVRVDELLEPKAEDERAEND